MKKTYSLILLVFSVVATAQVQKIFFVNDAKTIEYVTVNFCVNDSAKIDQVTVLPEKTTYKNGEVINALIVYLKSIQYYPNSKLRNNCYDSTFEFVNSLFENAQLTESDIRKCENFKVGKFRYTDIRYLDTKVKRKRKTQTENSSDFNAKYQITWISPYEYNMKYLKVKEKENKHLLGNTISVKIIGITDTGYIYAAKYLDEPITIGEMVKI